MAKSSPALSHFTPSLMAPETLEQIFVKRHRELERILDQVMDGVNGGSHHHTLLIGPRGIGKTHLISMIFHRLNGMPELRAKCCIAWLVEEEWSVASWLDLLLVILRALLQRNTPGTQSEKAFQRELEKLYDLGISLAQQRAEQLLLDFLNGRSLVLLMENLDMIFDGLEEEGQQRWRSFLQEQANTSIVATSQSLFNAVSHRTRPFFGFFRQLPLEKFSLNDACDMLERVARLREDQALADFITTPLGRARVRAVAHFAGGSPRVYVILSQFLTRDSLDELVQPFMRMLDDLTPYYQARMQSLSPQQRKLVELLCLERAPLSVKALARRAFVTQQTTASQLRKLVELGFLVARESGRESYYELREPLMRLTFEVKMNRGEPIPLFLDFLRLWYPPEELHTRLELLRLLGKPGLEETRYITLAMEHIPSESDNPQVSACLQDFQQHIEKEEWTEAKVVAEELVALRGEAEDYRSLAMACYMQDELKEASFALENALSKEMPERLKTETRMALVQVHLEQGKTDVAISTLKKIDSKHRKVEWYVLSWSSYLKQGDSQKAMTQLNRAVSMSTRQKDGVQAIYEATSMDSLRQNMGSDEDLEECVQGLSTLLDVLLPASMIHLHTLEQLVEKSKESSPELLQEYLFYAVSLVPESAVLSQHLLRIEQSSQCDDDTKRLAQDARYLFLSREDCAHLHLLLERRAYVYLELVRELCSFLQSNAVLVKQYLRILQTGIRMFKPFNAGTASEIDAISLAENLPEIDERSAPPADNESANESDNECDPEPEAVSGQSRAGVMDSRAPDFEMESVVLSAFTFFRPILEDMAGDAIATLHQKSQVMGRAGRVICLVLLRFAPMAETVRQSRLADEINRTTSPAERRRLITWFYILHDVARLFEGDASNENAAIEEGSDETSPQSGEEAVSRSATDEILAEVLKRIPVAPPSQWRDLWREHMDQLPELAPILRILDVAEAYQARRDKRALLTLPLEERMVVAQFLKLTPEESATD